MTNIMLLHDNKVASGTVVASSEVASMPATNLQNPQRTVMWRSAVTGNVTVDITLAAGGEQIQAFALVDHNLSLGGTLRLQAWDDAIGGAVPTFDLLLQPYQPTYGYGALPYGAGLYGGYDLYISGLSISDARAVLRPILMTQIAPALSSLYWRMTINDSSVAYYQAGLPYLGPAWSPVVNFSWGSTRARQNRTRRRESRGGQYYGNKRTDRTIVQFNLEWLSDADRDRLWIINMLLGNAQPFILVQRPEGGYEQESTTLYGVFDQMTLNQAFKGTSKTPIQFQEVL